MPNNFTYNNGVPDGPDNPSDDQPDMKINTQSIDSIIAIDHIGFNTNGSGIHKQVTLLNQGAPGLGDGNGVMYANIVNGNSWPIWQNALGSTVMVSSATNNSSLGYVSLPGGILIQWGKQAGSSANTIPVSFPLQFTLASVPTNAYSVQVIPERAASSPGNDFSTVLVTGSVTSSGFTIGNVGSHTIVNWYWIAIGPLS